MKTPDQWQAATKAIHTGVYQDKTFNSVTTPIYPTSTFTFDRVGVTRGYDYTRSGNPTRSAAAENIAALEGGTHAWLTCTGMSAITTALHLFQSGDHLVAGHDIYGGTYRLFSSIAPDMGIDVSFVNMRDPEAVRRAIRGETRGIFIETPSNPLLNIVDIPAIAKIASEYRLTTIADNTFMTPLRQRPFEHGVSLVVHSTTKYLNGHSDVVGGAIVARDRALADRVGFLVNAMGTAGSPFDAWLTLRGIKTLAARMDLHERNALRVAEWLESHPAVARVYYPGLKSHPDHELAKRLMSGFGGMVTFDLKKGSVSPDDLFARLALFRLAESLGGVESLVEQPFTMSHASMNEEARRAAGITPETIRLSIGIEDAGDLIDDLAAGLG